MSPTATLALDCDTCDRAAADELYDGTRICDTCRDARDWEQDHSPADCDDAPEGAQCQRDHEAEIQSALNELAFDQAREEDAAYYWEGAL